MSWLSEITARFKRIGLDASEYWQPDAVDVPMREAHGVTVDTDDDQWRPLTGDSKRDLSPLTQDRMQEVALYLWEQNLLANWMIEITVAYLLAEGVRYEIDDEDDQDALNRFWNDPINDFDVKLPKKVRELLLFGEQAWPTFVNNVNGHVRLGYLDPATIKEIITDPDNGEQPIGIITKKDSKGRYQRFRVVINGGEDVFTQRTQAIREQFADGECLYFTINALSNGRRGRSALLAGADWLDAYDKLLFGELDRQDFLRAFIWDVELKGATQPEVDERAKTITTPAPGSTRVHNESETWKAETPDLKATDASETARLFRNHILGGFGLPEHWYGGGGDVNRSTGESMGEPTFKLLSMRQCELKAILKSVGVYVLRQRRLATGAEPEMDDPLYDLEVIFPEMTSKDTSRYATSLQQVTVAVGMLISQGLVTEATGLRIVDAIAGRLGVEFDVEDELDKARTEIAEKKARQAEADTFQDVPEDNAVGVAA
ncbi:MAG: hypothetical protein GXP10_10715 [Gammaproteobacteria bacterium]|nr:hypothetical protein [Gammaproteobacteria bacterium]